MKIMKLFEKKRNYLKIIEKKEIIWKKWNYLKKMKLFEKDWKPGCRRGWWGWRARSGCRRPGRAAGCAWSGGRAPPRTAARAAGSWCRRWGGGRRPASAPGAGAAAAATRWTAGPSCPPAATALAPALPSTFLSRWMAQAGVESMVIEGIKVYWKLHFISFQSI